MKKLISFVMAAVLCLGMSTAVFANSPSTDTVGVVEELEVSMGNVTGIKPDGSYDTVTLKSWDDAKVDREAVKHPGLEAKSNEWVEFVKSAVNVNMKEVYNFAEVHVEDNTAGTVPLPVPGVSAEDDVVALVWNGTDEKWEKAVVVEVKENEVTIKHHHFSPVLIVVGEFAVVTPPPQVVTPTQPTSPKTADAGLMVTMLAVAALAGVVVVTRKVKASK